MSKVIRSPYTRLALGLAASGFFLYLAFRNVTFQEVWEALSQANLAWVLAMLISLGLTTLFRIFRWQVLLGPGGKQVSFADLSMALLSGQMLNAIFPVRVGELSRAYIIGGMGNGSQTLGRVFVFGTLILEKILDMIWYALLLIIILLLIPTMLFSPPEWLGGGSRPYAGLTLVGAAAVLAMIIFLVAYQRQRVLDLLTWLAARLPAKIGNALLPRARSGLSSLDVLTKKTDLVKLSLWSTGIWVASVATNELGLRAMGISLPLSASVLLLAALQAGISLAAVPGRLGIFEYICVLVLGLYGVEQSVALSYGFLLHAVVFLPVILAGILSMWVQGWQPARDGNG
jgi:hypothetical protein